MASTYNPLNIELEDHQGSTFALFGASKSGKTTALLWLWRKYFQNHIPIICSPNLHKSIYQPILKRGIGTPYMAVLTDLLKSAWMAQKNTGNKYRFLIILDDVLVAKSSAILRELILTFRNSDISTIISLQGQTLLDKNNRSSVNYGLFFRYNSLEGSKDVVERFMGDLIEGRTLNEKSVNYESMMRDHHFIIRNNLTNEWALTKIPKHLVEK